APAAGGAAHRGPLPGAGAAAGGHGDPRAGGELPPRRSERGAADGRAAGWAPDHRGPDRVPGGAGGAEQCGAPRSGRRDRAPGGVRAGGGHAPRAQWGPADRAASGPCGPRHRTAGDAGAREPAGRDARARPRPGRRLDRPRPPAADRRPPGAHMTITVLIADDAAMVRAGFAALLDAQEDLRVVGQVTDGREAVARAARLRPDVILMDVRMPEMNGIEATERIGAPSFPASPPPRILM